MAGNTRRKKVLCVGLLCLDIVSVCDSYPLEDSDQRVHDQVWQRGGNASNNATVLSKLGLDVDLFATIGNDFPSQFVFDDLVKARIGSSLLHLISDLRLPISCVVLNQQNGSRTILQARFDYKEPSFEQFEKFDFSSCDWVQFEGRNEANVLKMIDHIERLNQERPEERRIRISVELEKPQPKLLSLIDVADVVFVSKEFSKMHGHDDMHSAVHSLYEKLRPGAILVCPWGEQGAAARQGEKIVTCPAFPLDRVVDTLGAGDTFVASFIAKMLESSTDLEASLTFACRIAGLKCGAPGYSAVPREFIE